MSLYDYFNSFSRYIEEERPSDKAIVLYWSMLDMFNRRGWPEWTAADRQKLMLMCNTTNRKAMEGARTVLCQAGFLEYRPGTKKGQATRYHLLIPEKYRGKKGGESVPRNDPQNDVILYKTKNKNLSSSLSSTTTAQTPRGRLPPDAANPELSRVMAAYDDFLPGASDSSKARLAKYCQSLGAELCLHAMDVARDAGQRTWQYLNGILHNWTQAGIRSLADMEKRETERRRRRQNGNGTYTDRGGSAQMGEASGGVGQPDSEYASADEQWGIRSAF